MRTSFALGCIALSSSGCLNQTAQLTPLGDAKRDAGSLDGCGNRNPTGVIRPFVTYTGNAYSAISSGDLNGDGMLDLVVTFDPWWYHGIDIFLGQPDGGLSAPTYYPESDGFARPVLADVNGDGMLDVVVSDGPTAVVLMQLIDGGFAPVVYPAASNVGDIGVVDVNGDGMPDLVLAEYGTPLTPAGAELRLNQGAGVFGAPRALPGVAGEFGGMVVGDFNGDWLGDIFIDSPDGGTVLLLNTGDGGFSVQSVSVAPWAEMVALLTPQGQTTFGLTGFGGVQLVTLSSAGQLTMGAFLVVPVSQGTPIEDQFIVVGDFNDDGIQDIAMSGHYACQHQGGASIFFGLADGGFETALAVATAGYATTGVAPVGPVDHPRALAIADGCNGGLTISGDASSHCMR
jgi:hypothetical protein